MNPDAIENRPTIIQRIRDAWEEDPAMVLLGVSAVIFASAKFIDTTSQANSRRLQNRQSRYYFKVSRKHPLTFSRELPPV